MMPDIKIAFFDVDGTLASNTNYNEDTYERIPESARNALKRLQDNGIIPVIATGRSRIFIQPLAKKLGMNCFIASNGLSVTYKDEEIYHNYLTKAELIEILEKVNSLKDVTILLETARGNIDFTTIANIERFDDTYQVIVVGENLKQRVDIDNDRLKARMVAPVAMNIYPAHLSKASGIQEMLDRLGLTPEQAICFGDEENDIEMFFACAYTVAMGNGSSIVKDLASYVTESVDENGIYNACKHFGLF